MAIDVNNPDESYNIADDFTHVSAPVTINDRCGDPTGKDYDGTDDRSHKVTTSVVEDANKGTVHLVIDIPTSQNGDVLFHLGVITGNANQIRLFGKTSEAIQMNVRRDNSNTLDRRVAMESLIVGAGRVQFTFTWDGDNDLIEAVVDGVEPTYNGATGKGGDGYLLGNTAALAAGSWGFGGMLNNQLFMDCNVSEFKWWADKATVAEMIAIQAINCPSTGRQDSLYTDKTTRRSLYSI